ncbi:MAG: glycoside hydrolase family 97 protein [Dysgonamonadaceae bacterium]|jgi:alpha-glucosidase|nr:glycoside hydrolase family 97 protein [Dysgonamonadaceae bacterium]
MKQLHRTVFFLTMCLSSISLFAGKVYTLHSPNGKLAVSIAIDKDIQYAVTHEKDEIIAPSVISLTLGDGKSFGKNPVLKKQDTKTVKATIQAVIYKKKQIADHYNEQVFTFKEGFLLIFRAYDDGAAYRFVSTLDKPFVVESEEAAFNFPNDAKAYIPYVNRSFKTLETQFYNSFENQYSHIALSEWEKNRLAFVPVLVEGVNGKKVCITEADLLNYPGMYLYPNDTPHGMKGVFAPYPKEIKQGGHNLLQGEVQSREPFIAKLEGKTNFPWRIIIVSTNDAELANSDMVYRLASPNPQNDDFSWIKPGKVAWDWWNDWNLYNVDFKAGVNTETYKYYIDFAAQWGVEYVILDEGWAVNKAADLYQIVPAIDLKELAAYANEKKVSLILWAGYYAFNKDIEGICKHYAEMGIKGFKVDFMDRDDQPMVQFHAEVARIAAKYHLLIDFHGTYKPTGLQRTFPNVINFEGVYGLEQMKWDGADSDQVTYDVSIPFIRMVAGPFDYTQGAMRNAARGNYRPVYTEAMSQGTRCRQLAEYVIFESPLNMLCDSPSNYNSEPECTEFIASVPTVWENTVALTGQVGQYIAIARQNGSDWYVGALTNWTPRSLELDLSFLNEGRFQAVIFKDGINAGKAARDYKKETIAIPANRKLVVNLAAGGGFVMKISPV